MVKPWPELNSDEKQEAMFQRWLAPTGVMFASPEAERAYKGRVMRIKDAIQLKLTKKQELRILQTKKRLNLKFSKNIFRQK